MNFKNKKLFSLILSLALVLSIFIMPIQNVFAEEAANVKEITIVHTNDVHSRVDSGIGYAKIATKVKELKAENPNLLLVDAGDVLHGQTIATISRGESIIELMNAMGYDVMTPGNHDFNYGFDRLVELSEKAKFPIISANLVKADGTLALEPYIIKEIDGVKIGIFGLSTPETAYKTNPKNVEGMKFEDPINAAKEMVDKLKGEGAQVIIALSHLGLDKASEVTSEKVATEVKGIDIIIDGHSHTKLEEGKLVGDTLIAQTGQYDENLGIVNIEVTDGKVTKKVAKLFTSEEAADLAEDEEIKAMIDGIKEKNKEITSEVVGKTAVTLDGVREHVRAGETNLGNLITDAIKEVTGADVVITNGGGIRASIEVGEITKEDVINVLPFGNYVVVKEIKGSDILAALEHGTSKYPEPDGPFPHVAGMTYRIGTEYRINPINGARKRVYDVKVGDQPLDLEKTYKLATNDFMAAGGDGYTMFADGKILNEYPGLDEIVANYIKELGEVNIGVEGRIIADEVKTEEPKAEESVVEPKQQKEETYIVKPGDVLWKIAKKFGLTWEKLAEYNKLANPHLIFPGQKILVPVK